MTNAKPRSSGPTIAAANSLRSNPSAAIRLSPVLQGGRPPDRLKTEWVFVVIDLGNRCDGLQDCRATIVYMTYLVLSGPIWGASCRGVGP
jgi:hypothetical protein